jgi:(p)ppGpp synthase/HD superfamily hydrolase
MINLDIFREEEILSCLYSKRLLEKLYLINLDIPENSKIDIPEVKKGIIYAKYYHGDQRRDSGEPYYSHPLEVAYMVADYLPRTDIIITAILHDTLEDTELRQEEIIKVFGRQVSEQVYDLTRIKDDGTRITSAQMVEDLWIQSKHDILIVKLCDRLHNMQSIHVKPENKILKITEETLKAFLSLSIFIDSRMMNGVKIEELLIMLCERNLTKNHTRLNLNTVFAFTECDVQMQFPAFQNDQVPEHIRNLLA